jgi:hypothetical protein
MVEMAKHLQSLYIRNFLPLFLTLLTFLCYKIKQGPQSRRLAFNPISPGKELVLLQQILQIGKGINGTFLRQQTQKT